MPFVTKLLIGVGFSCQLTHIFEFISYPFLVSLSASLEETKFYKTALQALSTDSKVSLLPIMFIHVAFLILVWRLITSTFTTTSILQGIFSALTLPQYSGRLEGTRGTSNVAFITDRYHQRRLYIPPPRSLRLHTAGERPLCAHRLCSRRRRQGSAASERQHWQHLGR